MVSVKKKLKKNNPPDIYKMNVSLKFLVFSNMTGNIIVSLLSYWGVHTDVVIEIYLVNYLTKTTAAKKYNKKHLKAIICIASRRTTCGITRVVYQHDLKTISKFVSSCGRL